MIIIVVIIIIIIIRNEHFLVNELLLICSPSDRSFVLFSASAAGLSPVQSSQDSRQTSKGVAVQIETQTDEEEDEAYPGNQASCCHGAQREIGKQSEQHFD